MPEDEPGEFPLPIPGRPKLKDATEAQMLESWRYYRMAGLYQEPEVQNALDYFYEAHGRFPRTPDEVKKWAATPEGKRALAKPEK